MQCKPATVVPAKAGTTVAGLRFRVKEVQAAQGNLSLGVGPMFLLMVVTIFYVPIVLPLLLPGAAVNGWDIAKSLIMTMLVLVVLGLMDRSHSRFAADLDPDRARWAKATARNHIRNEETP